MPPEDAAWEPLLPRTKLGPHRQHCLQVAQISKPTTHVRLTIYPDGGVKRLRLVGRRATLASPKEGTPKSTLPVQVTALANAYLPPSPSSENAECESSILNIPALPLTPEAFASYGWVIQSYPNPHHAPKGIQVDVVNFGSAMKFNRLSPIIALPIPGKKSLEQRANLSVFRGKPTQSFGGAEMAKFEVKVLERHEYTSQTFTPLAAGGDRYLVIVALPSEADGSPDLKTLRAFIGSTTQGFTYKPNVSYRTISVMSCLIISKQIWHHPMVALDITTDFACITNETGDSTTDCEILEYGETVALIGQDSLSMHRQ